MNPCGSSVIPPIAAEYGIMCGMTLRLYHGSQNENVRLQYGLGEDRHDFADLLREERA